MSDEFAAIRLTSFLIGSTIYLSHEYGGKPDDILDSISPMILGGFVKSKPFTISGPKFHHSDFNKREIVSSSNLYLIIFAGTPPTIAYGGTSFVTTAPLAITAPSPTEMPCKIITPVPI